MSFTLYPAIDLRGGNVVRLKEGDLTRLTVYSQEPAEVARRWLDAGARWLHVVNLDGAFGEKDDANRGALELILEAAKEFGVQVQFGGGIRSLDALTRVMNMGVRRAVLGTVAIEQPNVVAGALKEFGTENVAVGIDARDGLARVRGWKEDSRIPATELAGQMRRLGLRTAVFTDVSRDGLGSGLNIPATRQLAEVSGLEVIASGGVHRLDDVLAAREANLAGVVIGRALYEETFNLQIALELSAS